MSNAEKYKELHKIYELCKENITLLNSDIIVDEYSTDEDEKEFFDKVSLLFIQQSHRKRVKNKEVL